MGTSMKPQKKQIHKTYGDFLGLADRRFSDTRLIVFTGVSGSGKSTAIEFLLEDHADFVGCDYVRVDSRPLEFRDTYATAWIVIDEIIEWHHLWDAHRLLRCGHRLIVANHLPSLALKCLFAPWRGVYLCTDDDPTKIRNYLERLGVVASDEAVERFCRTYRASFTDVDIILEHFSGTDFDTSLRRFERFCTITKERNTQG